MRITEIFLAEAQNRNKEESNKICIKSINFWIKNIETFEKALNF
jgi:hypothetical protein